MTVLPFTRRGNLVQQQSTKQPEERNEEIKPRSIHLPTWLWDSLDKDAKRCKRSATKQLEAFLTLCFDPKADIEINREIVTEAFEATSHERLKKTA